MLIHFYSGLTEILFLKLLRKRAVEKKLITECTVENRNATWYSCSTFMELCIYVNFGIKSVQF